MRKPILLVAALLAGTAHAQTVPQYRLVDLGFLNPGPSATTTASDINDAGAIVGTSTPTSSGGAYVWRDGTMTNLGDLPGGRTDSAGYAINNSGQVVGTAWTGLGSHAFLYQNGVMQDLGELPGGLNVSVASAVNDNGQVVGYSHNGTFRAVLWQNGTLSDLGALPGGNFSFANDINNAGDIVGNSGTAEPGERFAALWRDGAATVLSSAASGQTLSDAEAINEGGSIVGYGAVDPQRSAFHAMLWNDGTITDLGALENPGSSPARSVAHDINDAGLVVGTSQDDFGSSGFLWQDGEIYSLNNLIAANDPLRLYVTISDGFAINESGWIAAVGLDSSGNGGPRGYLLIPTVPLPAAVWMMISGLGLALLRFRPLSPRV